MASKLSLLLFVPFAVACGDDGGSHPIVHDSNMGSGSGSGSQQPACALNASYSPAFGSDNDVNFATDYPTGYFRAGSGSGSTATPPSVHQIWYVGVLENADIADVLYIDLYAKYGGFGSGDIVPGTYVLANDELTYNDCGICVYGAGDFDTSSGDVAEWYMATGGTVTLTSVTAPVGSAAGHITGSWTGVSMQHVEDDGNGFIGGDATPVGNCTSAIGDATFDIPLDPPAMGSGSGSGSATGKPQHIRIPLKAPAAKALHHRFY